MSSELRQEVIDHFGGIVDHHCLNFPFIIIGKLCNMAQIKYYLHHEEIVCHMVQVTYHLYQQEIVCHMV